MPDKKCCCNCPGIPPTLSVGDTLYGFAGGTFGSSSYGPRLVIHIAADYVVYREDGYARIWNGDPSELVQYTTEEEED